MSTLGTQLQKEKEITKMHARAQELSIIKENRRNTSTIKVNSFSHEGFDLKTPDSRSSSRKGKRYEKGSSKSIKGLNRINSPEKNFIKAIPTKPVSPKRTTKGI